MAEYWDRERGRRYRGEGYYGGYYGNPERERDRDREREYERRGGDRGFFDRAGDEVRSWFGDEDAQHRRMRDEREVRTEDRGWGREERGGGGARGDDEAEREREWARQWGYVEGRGSRGGHERDARGWGYSGGYGAGAGFVGGRSSSMGRSMMGGPYAGRGPRGYQRSDERIREDVCERMSDCGELDASEIEVRVSNAEVTLQGTVRDRHDKRLAEDLVDEVAGVREVHNQIRLSQPGSDAGQAQQHQRYRIA